MDTAASHHFRDHRDQLAFWYPTSKLYLGCMSSLRRSECFPWSNCWGANCWSNCECAHLAQTEPLGLTWGGKSQINGGVAWTDIPKDHCDSGFFERGIPGRNCFLLPSKLEDSQLPHSKEGGVIVMDLKGGQRSEVLIFPLSEAHLLPFVEKGGLAITRYTTFIGESFFFLNTSLPEHLI